jgi:hypothetical protein
MKKQAIRAVSRQTIVPTRLRTTVISWPLPLQCRTAGTLQLRLFTTHADPKHLQHSERNALLRATVNLEDWATPLLLVQTLAPGNADRHC